MAQKTCVRAKLVAILWKWTLNLFRDYCLLLNESHAVLIACLEDFFLKNQTFVAQLFDGIFVYWINSGCIGIKENACLVFAEGPGPVAVGALNLT